MSVRAGLAGLLAIVVMMCAWPSVARAQSDTGAQRPTPAPSTPEPAGRHHPAEPRETPDVEQPPFVPPITDADRRAAFPDVHGHAVHDDAVNYFVLVDRLEWQPGAGASAASPARGAGMEWDSSGWIGKDIDRLLFRTEGSSEGGRLAAARVEVLYGRHVTRWWDAVAGVRQDVRPGPAQTWATVGIQGLAPYWFDIAAMISVTAGGHTHFRFETEYDLLLTNRLVLQPLLDIQGYGKADPERRVGAGLSMTETGLRLRYEVRRELAPYAGVTWRRYWFGTAEAARASGERTSDARVVFGIRLWM